MGGMEKLRLPRTVDHVEPTIVLRAFDLSALDKFVGQVCIAVCKCRRSHNNHRRVITKLLTVIRSILIEELIDREIPHVVLPLK